LALLPGKEAAWPRTPSTRVTVEPSVPWATPSIDWALVVAVFSSNAHWLDGGDNAPCSTVRLSR